MRIYYLVNEPRRRKAHGSYHTVANACFCGFFFDYII